ncbi:ABC transporter permease, partial [Bacteroidales bacterium OttesenSCG-928-J19]|nr:ABC transporter permease [Bacteroidales bacterium OttesenSCG-928-J19]
MKTYKYLQKALTDMFVIWRNELEHVFKDAGVVIFFLVVPLAYPVIYGLIYNTETVREVPMVVVEESHSSLAREMIRKIDGTPDVRVVRFASTMEEARRLVDEK